MKTDPVVVNKIRSETGAGLMDVCRALELAEGDQERARLLLYNKGLAVAHGHKKDVLCEICWKVFDKNTDVHGKEI